MSPVRAIARPLLAGSYVLGGISALRAPGALRLLFPLALVGSMLALRALARWQGLPPGRAMLWAAAHALTWLNGLFFLLAAAAILVNADAQARAATGAARTLHSGGPALKPCPVRRLLLHRRRL